MRGLALVLTLAALAAACGGESTAERRAGLVEECVAGASETASSLPVAQMTGQRMLEDWCKLAADAGYLDDEDLTRDEFLGILRANPSSLDPFCTEGAEAGFRMLPSSARSQLDVTSEEWGRQMCAALVEGDYFTAEMNLPPTSIERLMRDHPELAVPFMVAGIMEAYDPSLGVPRKTFEEIARRASEEALRRGLVKARSFSEYDIDEAAFRSLLREVAEDVAKE